MLVTLRARRSKLGSIASLILGLTLSQRVTTAVCIALLQSKCLFAPGAWRMRHEVQGFIYSVVAHLSFNESPPIEDETLN